MIASVHLADVGARSVLRTVSTTGPLGSVPGLRYGTPVIAAPLSSSVLPAPDLGRLGLIAFWDDDAALDDFLAGPPAAPLAGGWHVRLEPLRATGSWPGLPDDLPTRRTADGPAVTVTLGRLRLGQAVRFLRASAKAQAAALAAPGLSWATGLARPPLVATCSLWESVAALSAYAHGPGAHRDALAADRDRPFHHRSAFVTFRPYRCAGRLDGRNPLPQDWAARV